MTRIPPDFGGFVCAWDPDAPKPRAIVVRYGQGEPQEGMSLTPLNVLQLRRALDTLIEDGRVNGHITDEHLRQSQQLPSTRLSDAPSRSHVDRIAGTE